MSISRGSAWLGLDPDGEPLFRVQIPRDVAVMVADLDRVWGRQTDELDVPYLVRFTFERP